MKRGEIWLVDFAPTIGAEITKTRPAVIMSDDGIGVLPLKLVAPITTWQDHFSQASWIVAIEPDEQTNHLARKSAVDLLQLRCVSYLRFSKQLGRMSGKDLALLEDAARHVMKL